jgi:hypothetical protein
MDLEYEHQLFNVENDVQDKNSLAWKKLCEYVEKIANEEADEFSPLDYLGKELFSQIHTLPESIGKLKKVKKMWLYGSQLKRIPPEIGEMEAMEYFDPYTSYNLHWFPYEITNCKKIKDSRVSTRALYGNYKYRRPFPDLTSNPVRYEGDIVKCSVCKKEMSYQEINQLWISLRVGTDVLPLLVNLCSKKCENELPQPPKDYIQYAHKGGEGLMQPLDENTLWELEWAKRQANQNDLDDNQTELNNSSEVSENKIDIKDLPLLKLIRKIWEK